MAVGGHVRAHRTTATVTKVAARNIYRRVRPARRSKGRDLKPKSIFCLQMLSIHSSRPGCNLASCASSAPTNRDAQKHSQGAWQWVGTCELTELPQQLRKLRPEIFTGGCALHVDRKGGT